MVIPILRNICEDLLAVDATYKARLCYDIYSSGKVRKATTQVRQILGEIQKATTPAVLSTEEVTKGVSVTTAVASQAGGTIKILTETLTEAAQAATQDRRHRPASRPLECPRFIGR